MSTLTLRNGLNQLLSQLEALPPLPSNTSRLLSLDHRDPACWDEATKIVSTDPALASEVVKMANSALYPGTDPVVTLDDALMRVGIREVCGALALSWMERVFRPPSSVNGDAARRTLVDIWVANLLCALVARELSRTHSALDLMPQQAYTHALLHHVGRLVMVAFFPKEMDQLTHEWPHPLLVLPGREEEVFGFSHELAGRMLANHWEFPPALTQVIAAHHLPPERRLAFPAEVHRMIDLVNLGDCIADTLRDVTEFDDEAEARVRSELDESFLKELRDRLALDPDTVIACLPEILTELARLRSAVG
ncbi:MAG: hypothetical protein CMJ83_14120 [Planctomycetes bacterium]|nr:hypothetical protein [Planctomycetota bacterium]